MVIIFVVAVTAITTATIHHVLGLRYRLEEAEDQLKSAEREMCSQQEDIVALLEVVRRAHRECDDYSVVVEMLVAELEDVA